MEINSDPGQGEQEKMNPPILKLPVEMIQEIASQLPSDRDLCKMIRTCKYFAGNIKPPGSGVWRARFLKLYDHPPPNMPSLEVEYEYKFRSAIFALGACFRKDEGEREALWLHCIATMLRQSYNPPPRSLATPAFSRNVPFIEEQTQKSDFFYQTIYKPDDACYPPTARFLAVQLTMTYFVLQPESYTREAPGDYCLGDIYDWRQIVTRDAIDLRRALHIRNFWTRHLTVPQEYTYHQSYTELGVGKRPTAWTRRLGNLQPLGSLWLGYYSCLHPFDLTVRQTCADLASHWTTIPVLALKLKTTSDSTIWPELFNSYYPRNIDIKDSDRSHFHGEQSLHNTPCSPEYMLRGFTEVYPVQGGIPGWRRISFVIFKSQHNHAPRIYEDDGSEDDDAGPQQKCQWQPKNWEMDFQFAYGYQGIVVPGGKLMLGGWMDLVRGIEATDSGPFIFWDVPKL